MQPQTQKQTCLLVKNSVFTFTFGMKTLKKLTFQGKKLCNSTVIKSTANRHKVGDELIHTYQFTTKSQFLFQKSGTKMVDFYFYMCCYIIMIMFVCALLVPIVYTHAVKLFISCYEKMLFTTI